MKRTLVLSALTGIMLALALPPFKTSFFAFGALIPFFLLLESQSYLGTLRWGYITGFIICTLGLFWIGWVTIAGLLGALLVIPLYATLFVLGYAFLYRTLGDKGLLFIPFLWVTIEYLQTLGDTAFPWLALGYTQTYHLPWIQFAEYTGVYGVSFLVVSINVLGYLLIRRRNRPRIRLLAGGGLVILSILPYIHGLMVMDTLPPKSTLCVALVQGNIDPFEKWNAANKKLYFDRYDSLSHSLLPEHPDLIVWPETATPFYLRYEYSFLDRIRKLVDQNHVSLLTGSVDLKHDVEAVEYYNSALLVTPGEQTIQHYAKMKLVPFSEKVPYDNMFPFNVLKTFLYDMKLGIGDYKPGNRWTLFELPPASISSTREDTVRFATPICYESVFPDQVRRFVRRGCDFVTIITNDAWFGRTSAPYQHSQIAVFRAIENRRAVVRCANTGISCFIDPFGHVRQATSLFEQTTLVDNIVLNDQLTFFTRHGNWIARLAFGVSFLGVLWAGVMRVIRYRQRNI